MNCYNVHFLNYMEAIREGMKACSSEIREFLCSLFIIYRVETVCILGEEGIESALAKAYLLAGTCVYPFCFFFFWVIYTHAYLSKINKCNNNIHKKSTSKHFQT